jgi:Phosphodiester glycosidase
MTSSLMKLSAIIISQFVFWTVSASVSTWAESDLVKILETRDVAQKPSFLKIIEKRVLASESGEFTITVLIVDPKKNRLKLALPTDSAAYGSSLARFYLDEDALAVMSAGFLRTYSPVSPAGLLKFDGAIINTLSNTDPALGGIVCFANKNQELTIAARSNTHIIDISNDCIQGGPLFISEGIVHDELERIDSEYTNFSSRRYVRTFLAKSKRGEILLGYTSPTSLFALRRVLLMGESEGGLQAVAAVGLTGGTQTAGLIVRATDPRQPFSRGNTTTPLPNALAVMKDPQ